MFHFLWHTLHTNKCLGFFNKKKNLLKLFTKTDSFEFHDHFFFYFQTWTSSSSFKAWIMMLKVLENLMIQETCIKRLIFSRERERESFNYWVLFQVPDCCQYMTMDTTACTNGFPEHGHGIQGSWCTFCHNLRCFNRRQRPNNSISPLLRWMISVVLEFLILPIL